MNRNKSKNEEGALRDLLMATSHQKLVDIVLSLRARNRDFQRQFDLIFVSLDDNPDQLISMIKKEIASLKRSSKFVDYYESDSLADRLDDLRSRIANDLNARSPKIAFEMMLDFLDIHGKTLERSDDSNGTISGVFFTACQDLGTLAAGHLNQSNNHDIVQIVFERFMHNDYGIYDDIIEGFKGVFTDQDFALLHEKIEIAANDTNSFRIRHGLKSIADCRGDIELYIKACSYRGSIFDSDHLEIAKRLIKYNRPKEALEWLEAMEMRDNAFWQEEKNDLKIQALELDNNPEEAQKERLTWFAQTLSPKLYREILKAAKPDFRQVFQLDAIKMAFQFPEPHTALDFLVKVKEVEEAAKFVRTRYKEINGAHHYTLRPAANRLKLHDPAAASLLYRKMIEAVMEGKNSKHYSCAAKDLVTCCVLDSKITNWGELQSHCDYLREIENTHRRKRSFWSEYTSALQKHAAKEAKMALQL